jgi:hypothetical protein
MTITTIKDIPDWFIPALKKEIKNHFKERAIVPEYFSISSISATNLHAEELKRVREEELEYYDDFTDIEIPLITDDVYAAAYEIDIPIQEIVIIDSFMDVEKFNLQFLKDNLIPDQKEYFILSAYGQLQFINEL